MNRHMQKEILAKLRTIIRDIVPSMEDNNWRINDLMGILQDVRRVCQKRFSAVRVAYT